MPYVLAPSIDEKNEGFWAEGSPYSKDSVYSIEEEGLPPVNYDTHHIKSHSITHAEAPKHTQLDGKCIESFFKGPKFFYGNASVVRLKGNNYKLIDKKNGIYHWEVKLEELKEHLFNAPQKLLLTTDEYPIKPNCKYHDPNFVLTLSQEAADWLVSHEDFNLYGTSWKSSDFKPGSMERPIHNTLFSRAMILECLDLRDVPAGEYFYSGAPIPLIGASESPICPMLFTNEELQSYS